MRSTPVSTDPKYLITTPPLKASEVNEGDWIVVWSFPSNRPAAVGRILEAANRDVGFIFLRAEWHTGSVGGDSISTEKFSAESAGLTPYPSGMLDSSMRTYSLPEGVTPEEAGLLRAPMPTITEPNQTRYFLGSGSGEEEEEENDWA